jgi:transcriptional regulator with XRE-family HTH domain
VSVTVDIVKIRRLREDAGLRLTDVASKIGVDPSYLSRIESGQKRATIENLVGIARALHCKVDDLLLLSTG